VALIIILTSHTVKQAQNEVDDQWHKVPELGSNPDLWDTGWEGQSTQRLPEGHYLSSLGTMVPGVW
jgi:hypothetical protein